MSDPIKLPRFADRGRMPAKRWAELAEQVIDSYADARRRVTCVYCGHCYPEGTPESQNAALTEHIAICERHPMRAVRAEVDRLTRELADLCGYIRDSYAQDVEDDQQSPIKDLLRHLFVTRVEYRKAARVAKEDRDALAGALREARDAFLRAGTCKDDPICTDPAHPAFCPSLTSSCWICHEQIPRIDAILAKHGGKS